jgi:hypothetical protein
MPELSVDECRSRLQRLRRIERDLGRIEDELREQASGSQDGYLLDIANRLRKILA